MSEWNECIECLQPAVEYRWDDDEEFSFGLCKSCIEEDVSSAEDGRPISREEHLRIQLKRAMEMEDWIGDFLEEVSPEEIKIRMGEALDKIITEGVMTS